MIMLFFRLNLAVLNNLPLREMCLDFENSQNSIIRYSSGR